jgi:hypothetical protein
MPLGQMKGSQPKSKSSKMLHHCTLGVLIRRSKGFDAPLNVVGSLLLLDLGFEVPFHVPHQVVIDVICVPSKEFGSQPNPVHTHTALCA